MKIRKREIILGWMSCRNSKKLTAIYLTICWNYSFFVVEQSCFAWKCSFRLIMDQLPMKEFFFFYSSFYISWGPSCNFIPNWKGFILLIILTSQIINGELFKRWKEKEFVRVKLYILKKFIYFTGARVLLLFGALELSSFTSCWLGSFDTINVRSADDLLDGILLRFWQRFW